MHLVSTPTPHLLSETSFQTLWVTWDRGTVAVGQGPLLHNNTLLKWRMDKKLKVQHIGFASGWGHMAEFRLVWPQTTLISWEQSIYLKDDRYFGVLSETDKHMRSDHSPRVSIMILQQDLFHTYLSGLIVTYVLEQPSEMLSTM